MNAPLGVTPDLISLFALFPPGEDLPEHELVPADALPEPFRTLLAHEHHMTITVEAYHGDLVDVHPLARHRDGNSYSRKIILTLQKTGRVVLFGIIRVNLDYCTPAVREAILAENTPLGRILIENNVMRRIEPTAYFKVEPGPQQLTWFGLEAQAGLPAGAHADLPKPMYGRLGFIHCDEQPAVELLEIVVEK